MILCHFSATFPCRLFDLAEQNVYLGAQIQPPSRHHRTETQPTPCAICARIGMDVKRSNVEPKRTVNSLLLTRFSSYQDPYALPRDKAEDGAGQDELFGLHLPIQRRDWVTSLPAQVTSVARSPSRSLALSDLGLSLGSCWCGRKTSYSSLVLSYLTANFSALNLEQLGREGRWNNSEWEINGGLFHLDIFSASVHAAC